MSEKGGTSNGGFSYRRVRRSMVGDRKTSVVLANADHVDLCFGSGQVVRTYKRRNTSGSKNVSFFERESLGGLIRKSTEPTMKEAASYLCNGGSVNASLGDSNRQCRTFVLQHMYQSLKSDDDGIRRCLRDAQMESDGDEESRQSPSQTIPASKENDYSGNHSFISNGDLGNESIAVSETCGRAFFNVIQSEKFTQLCRLLFENFQGIKTEKLLDLSTIDRRMKEGAYDHSPLLFSSDIQQLWVELQKIGTELVTLSTGLLDFSRICLNEQMGRLIHSTSNDVNREVCARRSESLGKPNRTEACRQCGGEVSSEECLVCDWCDKMYHASCVDPSLKDIPCSWFCFSCKTSELGTDFHDNCIVCARVNASRVHSKRLRGNPSNVLKPNEAALSHIEGNPRFVDKAKKHGTVCKFCEVEVERNDKMKTCEHLSCPFKYYHVRCLSGTQLKSHGPRWYCPSCLCRVCLTDKDDDKIVLCDCCDSAHHIYCLNPPLQSIPRGKWSCRQCDVDLQIILNVRSAYQVLEFKRKVEHSVDKKSRRGMDMLLSAALKCEESPQTFNHRKTRKSL